MGWPAAIGMGVGSLISGLGQQRAQQSAQQQQQQWLQMLMGRADALRWNDSPYAGQLQDFINSGLPAGAQYKPTDLTASLVDSQGILGAPGINAGNDALMQLLRANPQVQMNQSTDSALQSILGGDGSQFDASKAFGLLAGQDQYQTKQALTNLQGQAGSLGQRFGSANQKQASDLLANITGQLDARNAQISQSAFEAAQARRLQAAGLLTGREEFGLGLGQQNLDRQLSAANSLNSQGLSIAQLAAQLGLANQGAMNQFSQFNAQQGFNAAQFNQQSAAQAAAMRLQALQQGFGQEQAMRGYNAQLLSLLSGQQPQFGGSSFLSTLGGSIGDISQLMFLLPYLRNSGGGNG